MKIKILLLLCISAGVVSGAHAAVRTAAIFGPDMVLQRGEPVKIWGIADKNEKVEVAFNGQKVSAKTGKEGKWSVTLEAMPAGGPYTMIVKGKDSLIEYGNVMVGEVWLCSGQSNMEWVVRNSANAREEMAAASHPSIRCFTVRKAIAAEPQESLSGSWAVCSPGTAGDFTAVGYFFARKLWQELGVPVGIINSSWGGTDIEVWTSAGSYEALPTGRREYDPARIEQVRMMSGPEVLENTGRFQTALNNDPGIAGEWYANPGDPAEWKVMSLPKRWSETELKSDDGHVWFYREFELPASAEGSEGFLSLGPVDDMDITWINGVRVGATDRYDLTREYNVNKGILRGGRNVIAVRVTDNVGDGGFYGSPGQISIEVADTGYSLAGEWLYRPSVISTSFGLCDNNPNQYYATLYNAMINPITGFRIRGAIWYQGESNAWNARSYRTLFPNMITDWRRQWGYEFPFYWVQLANYMAEDEAPSDSQWAELREAQTMALSLPRTGQAVIIDIGDARNIHPANKQDVGLRLALNALNRDYGRSDIPYSGPVYSSVEFDGGKAVVSFDSCGSGLVARNKYGYVEGFAVAGADRVFHWGKARIDGGKVIVESDAVSAPVAVRYAWSDNPQSNLFNSEGLPAAPFRTDGWPGITR